MHIDTNPDNLNRFVAADAAVVADAATVADEIISWLDQAEVKPSGFASTELAERLDARPDDDFVDQSTGETIDIRTAMLRIERACPTERTLVSDGGRFIHTAFKLFHVAEPSAYVHTVNFGAIGLGMGNAVGASVGAPGRPTLLVAGDGGFMPGDIAEFSSAVRHKTDIVVVLFNDGAYGAEHIQFRDKKMDPAISMFDWPDFGPVATTLGGRGFTARNTAELDQALPAIEHRARPILIDIKVDPDSVPMTGH